MNLLQNKVCIGVSVVSEYIGSHMAEALDETEGLQVLGYSPVAASFGL